MTEPGALSFQERHAVIRDTQSITCSGHWPTTHDAELRPTVTRATLAEDQQRPWLFQARRQGDKQRITNDHVVANASA